MKEFKQLAGQTLIYGLGTMVPRLLNYVILTPYFTYYLFKNALEEYGKVTELYAYIAFLMIMLTYGMETTFFKFYSSEKHKEKVYSTIQTSLIVTSVLFLAIVMVFTNGISITLKYEGESIFIRLLAGILAVEAVSAVPFAKLRAENKALRFAILKIVSVSLNIMLMLGIYNIAPKVLGTNSFILNNEGVVSAKYIFISNLLASSTMLMLLFPELKSYKIGLFDFKLIKPVMKYGLPLMVSGLAGTINETLDRSIYKYIIKDTNTSLRELGIYGANYKIGGLIYIFIQMFRYAAEPFFFNKSKDKDSKEQYASLMNIFVGIVVAMGLFIVLFINLIKYFIGSSFHEGLYIVPYIVFGYVLYGILFNLSVWFKLSSKTQYALIITIAGAVVTIGINLAFVPTYRYGASAVAHIFSYSVMVVLSYLLSRKYYPINYNIGRITLYVCSGILIYLVFKTFTITNIYIDTIIRVFVLLLFVTFVAWKENIIMYIKKK